MGTITTEPIATMAYAPEGANDINLYSVGTASGLTFGQAVLAVCIRRITMLEQRSVVRMDKMASANELIAALNDWMTRIADTTENVDRRGITDFLVNTLHVEEDTVPAEFATYDKRLQVLEILKERMETECNESQQDMIELQSLLSIRDVASTLSANMTRGYGATCGTLARNM